MILLELASDWPIIITTHADRRLHERFALSDLDAIRDEIAAAIKARCYVHRARNIFYVYSLHTDRIYPLAVTRRKRGIRELVVMTVMDARNEPVAA